MRGITKSASLELAPFHIRVASIYPGIIAAHAAASSESEDVHIAASAATPADKIGTTGEVANIVLRLASYQAKFSMGAEFVVDGGFTAQ